MFHVRRGNKADISRIKDIYCEIVEVNYVEFMNETKRNKRLLRIKTMDYSMLFNNSQNFFIVVEHEKKIIGYLTGCNNATYEVTYIDEIRVSPEYQNKGIGKLLMSNIDQDSFSYPCIILVVNCDNVKATYFYEKLGFSEIQNYEYDKTSMGMIMHKGNCTKSHTLDECDLVK